MNGTDTMRTLEPPTDDAAGSERARARKRLEAKRDFVSNLVAFVTVNAFLVGIWAVTGAGYFWPGWVLGGWGIGVVMHFWDAFVRRPITNADVDAEVRRLER